MIATGITDGSMTFTDEERMIEKVVSNLWLNDGDSFRSPELYTIV